MERSRLPSILSQIEVGRRTQPISSLHTPREGETESQGQPHVRTPPRGLSNDGPLLGTNQLVHSKSPHSLLMVAAVEIRLAMRRQSTKLAYHRTRVGRTPGKVPTSQDERSDELLLHLPSVTVSLPPIRQDLPRKRVQGTCAPASH